MMTPTYLKGLNKQQRRAAKHGVKEGVAQPARPLLILAGAGTGKTKTLATRTAHLLLSGADASSMLIASFTKKSSKELVHRIRSIYRSATGRNVHLPYAGTFHSVAFSILREFAPDLGFNKFYVIDQAKAQELMSLIRKRDGYPRKAKQFPSEEQCLALHSYMTNACISLSAGIRKKFLHLKKWQKGLGRLFATYRSEKLTQRLMDYDDLLVQLSEALRHQRVGPALRRRFKYVMIDEYQDTNRLQLKILRRLKPDGLGVTVVGDDAQAIYSFRAATVNNIRQFRKCFAERASIVVLEENYRSTQPILAASNAVMSLSKDAFPKTLFSTRKSKRLPGLITVDDEYAQADYVVQKVLRARKQGIKLGEQAILFRASLHSHLLESQLLAADIPFEKWGGLKFTDKHHIRDLLAVLEWWENPRDRLAAFRVLKLLDGLGGARAANLLQSMLSKQLTKSLVKARPSGVSKKQWKGLVQLMKRAGDRWPSDLEAAVAWYRPYLESKFDDAADRVQDLEQLKDIATTFSSRDDFLSKISIDPTDRGAKQGRAKPSDDDVLTLSTIHSAKGQEWSKVIVLSAVKGCLPSSRSKGVEDVEEERRLFYVAMTRAKTELDVMVPRRIFQAQRATFGNLYVRPSPFLAPSIRRRFAPSIKSRG